MTQPETSDSVGKVIVDGELTHSWWRDEFDQVEIDGEPLQDLIAQLPKLNERNRMFRFSPKSEPYEVERHISYGRVRLTIERLD